jgi:hypothetical protein
MCTTGGNRHTRKTPTGFKSMYNTEQSALPASPTNILRQHYILGYVTSKRCHRLATAEWLRIKYSKFELKINQLSANERRSSLRERHLKWATTKSALWKWTESNSRFNINQHSTRRRIWSLKSFNKINQISARKWFHQTIYMFSSAKSNLNCNNTI